jgi:hypothetical protein
MFKKVLGGHALPDIVCNEGRGCAVVRRSRDADHSPGERMGVLDAFRCYAYVPRLAGLWRSVTVVLYCERATLMMSVVVER